LRAEWIGELDAFNLVDRMNQATLDVTAVTAVLIARYGGPIDDLQLECRPLRGGLCSDVWSLTARFELGKKRRCATFIAKLLEGAAVREAAVYSNLAPTLARSFSPEILGVYRLDEGRVLLYLERIRPAWRWPWRDTAWAAQVLDCLARLHTLPSPDAATLPAWDYEIELQTAAQALLELAEGEQRNASLAPLAPLTRSLPALRRMVSALPAVRRQLLSFQPLGRAVIHGDVHPGNALVRRRTAHHEPVFLDWGRARLGSPLEDVSSWLQSLGCWEPEAKRRHDTLFVGYLAARGLEPVLTRSLRDAYWLSAASNALSGALLHELSRASRLAHPSARRASALHAAGTWLRVIRRADACWG
jgi:hypothetical protein